MHIIIIDCIVQSGTAPPNNTAIPAASPNQSSPEPRIPGQAARVGQPLSLSSHTTPRRARPRTGGPSASVPGAKCQPALRIATKAEAHSATVTAAAATGPIASSRAEVAYLGNRSIAKPGDLAEWFEDFQTPAPRDPERGFRR